ncbi:hypothetical protein EVG20_g6335 [Dentipellis fragilis]|uniref:Uncharacterized protein n=1 Tax=Dentipellis fragilis TaxID=205917 RepID=A0A4Y9YPE4_9AGAM|nr:hypothetical protein EVG20_g6335 [Dentipellis fragilis]
MGDFEDSTSGKKAYVAQKLRIRASISYLQGTENLNMWRGMTVIGWAMHEDSARNVAHHASRLLVLAEGAVESERKMKSD